MLAYQFPLETNPADEGLTVVESGGGTVELVDGSLAGYGSKKLVCYCGDSSKVAYCYKNISFTPGQWLYVGVYLRPSIDQAAWLLELGHRNPFNLYHKSWTNSLELDFYNDAGVKYEASAGYSSLATFHFVVGFKRASTSTAADGAYCAYYNGAEICNFTELDNYDKLGSSLPLRLGTYAASGAYSDIEFDHLVFGTTLDDVLPDGVTPPTPADELPSRERSIVLFNQNDEDSRTLSESLNVDEAMLCPLPCSSDETLNDYADFQAEIENGLKSFLSFRPSVANQATCIIAGHNVPGYFNNGGSLYSTCNRLMNIDTAFTGVVDNPLLSSSVRLTATVLQASNMRLAARLDGTFLADCQALYNLGNGEVAVADSEKIFSSTTATLEQQKLRLQIELLADSIVENDALYYQHASASGVSWGNGGSRIAFISGLMTDLTRNEIAYAMNDWDYRSFISFDNDFDLDAFCEMLRIGGSIAEAFAVSINQLDAKNQLAAWPFMTASFPQFGYNVYLAEGDRNKIEYDSPVQYLPAASTEFSLKLENEKITQVISVRKVGSDGQIETRGRIMLVVAEEDNVFQQLPRPFDLSYRHINAKKIQLDFSCYADESQAWPERFKIFEFTAGSYDTGSPLAEILPEYLRQSEFSVEISIADKPVSLIAIAFDSSGNVSHPSNQLLVSELRKPSTPSLIQV